MTHPKVPRPCEGTPDRAHYMPIYLQLRPDSVNIGTIGPTAAVMWKKGAPGDPGAPSVLLRFVLRECDQPPAKPLDSGRLGTLKRQARPAPRRNGEIDSVEPKRLTLDQSAFTYTPRPIDE